LSDSQALEAVVMVVMASEAGGTEEAAGSKRQRKRRKQRSDDEARHRSAYAFHGDSLVRLGVASMVSSTETPQGFASVTDSEGFSARPGCLEKLLLGARREHYASNCR
jgi:hypothetical protein